MPYNTRRKSLSLPSLGIHVPMSNAARAAAAAVASRLSPSANASSATASSSSSGARSTTSHASAAPSPSSSLSSAASGSSSSSPTFSPRSPADSMSRKAADAQTSARKIKRSHASSHASVDGDRAAPSPKRRQTDANTPPPSPRNRARSASVNMYDLDDEAYAQETGVDLSRIDDEIVKAVIVQLQATRNRPHIVRDLATVLMKQVKIVQTSANPQAIISSRLSGFLKRSGWNARNPCPLAKELETVHPRRTYFYLTTVPHQALPDPMLSATKARELPTPSATSMSDAEDEERRRELSPSPEVDLSASEIEDGDDDVPMPATPIGSYSGRSFEFYPQLPRYASPPLEKDEKEFTRTADNLQRRKLSGELVVTTTEPVAAPTTEVPVDDHSKWSLFCETTPAIASAVATLTQSPAMAALGQGSLVSSPAIRPSYPVDVKKEKEAEATWASSDQYLDIRNPETISLDEIDEMLGDY